MDISPLSEVRILENKNVLSALSGGIFLSEINLAGTHDSATAFCAFSRLAKCQSHTFKEQLEMGVRLLDIRLCRTGNRFYLVHGKANCYRDASKKERLSFDEVFAVLQAFLRENPRETVVLSIKQDRGYLQKPFFKAFYNQYIRPQKNLWYLENRVPRLSECCGKLVLLRRCKKSADFEEKAFCGLDFSVWEDQASRTETSPLTVTLSADCRAAVQDRYRLAPEIKWNDCEKPFLESAQTSPHGICLHYLSTCGGGGVPEENAVYVNAQFSSYPLPKDRACGWFFLDFPTEALCDKIMRSNLELWRNQA